MFDEMAIIETLDLPQIQFLALKFVFVLNFLNCYLNLACLYL